MQSSDGQEQTNQKQHRKKEVWNYTPSLPVRTSPYFNWPINLLAILKWILSAWFPISERLIILVIAIISFVFLHPSLEQSREFSFDWIALIYFRNLALMILIAGGLHLYFYVFRCQKDERRYDVKPFPKDSANFTFRSQIKDNIFWSLASGVTIWTAYEVLILWAMANGYAPTLSMQTMPGGLIWLGLLIFIIPLWETVHFYLIHRLIHFSPLYRRIHSLHHRNTNVGPWSGLSMHPIEHLIYLSSVLIHFVVPAHPLLIIFHLQYFALSAVSTHTGYEGITARGRLILPLGTFSPPIAPPLFHLQLWRPRNPLGSMEQLLPRRHR